MCIPVMMIVDPKSCLNVIDSLKNSTPVAKRAIVSTPAMTTRILPSGWFDDSALIQNKFPIKNSIPEEIANAS